MAAAQPELTAVNQATLHSAISASHRPQRPNPLDASITMAWRALLKIKHVPMQLFDVTMFPIMMTLMFTFLFGGALAGSVGDYVQFLIPGIFVMTIAMITMYTGHALNTDISKGIFDRFRSLPFWRPAVLVGMLLGDTVRYSLAGMVVIVLGFILGFRPEGGIIGVLLSLILVLIFAFSLSWAWTVLGLVVSTPESTMMVSSMVSFPLTFATNIFVDPATMPEWLQVAVNLNPITHVVTAVRGLMSGTVTADQIGLVFLGCAILIAIFAPMTMYFYNAKGTR
ncbi:MAG: ABC transporter permease [Anaerolineae bacterium]|nr:ABC transporter permease [Anaerolineae bacterium]